MKVVIVEDELPAARRLKSLLENTGHDIQVLTVLDSVSSAKTWFTSNAPPDLIFLDIHLSDGYSFDIFDQIPVKTPVIFTTAYDQYALKAFEVNSIDYLLKPIDQDKLSKSLNKLQQLHQELNWQDLQQFLHTIKEKNNYKNRFLIKVKDQFLTVDIAQVAYFKAMGKLVVMVTHENRNFPMDLTLEELESQVDPARFFRINRQVLGSFVSIQKIHNFFNGKLKLKLKPDLKDEVLVSRDKAPVFKSWLEGNT